MLVALAQCHPMATDDSCLLVSDSVVTSLKALFKKGFKVAGTRIRKEMFEYPPNSGVARVYPPPCPRNTHYQFSIKTLLSIIKTCIAARKIFERAGN